MKPLKIAMLMLIILWGCEEDVNFWDECDRLDQGVVEVYNKTNIDLEIDVTTGTMEENDPILLNSNPYFDVITQFQGIYKGEAKVWITFQGKKWLHERVQVTPCEKTPCFIYPEDLQ